MFVEKLERLAIVLFIVFVGVCVCVGMVCVERRDDRTQTGRTDGASSQS